MKNIVLAITLGLTLSLSFASCGNKGGNNDKKTGDTVKGDSASAANDKSKPKYVCYMGESCGSSDTPGKECCGKPMVENK